MIVSVIIPIYRVEAYIERCVISLMEQTLDGVEFIFVDDCSPDKSMEVLERVLKDYPQRQPSIRILHHTVNRGLPASRNTGLAAATGDYIFHGDSDDYLEPDALEQMYKKAVEVNADIVYSDWFLTFSPSLSPSPVREGRSPSLKGRVRYMRCPEYATAEEALCGLLHGTMKYNVWNKLVRRSLYGFRENDNEDGSQNEIRFPEGHGMGEDMTMILLFAKAQKVAYLPKGTYHYVRQNENAFTAARSELSYSDLKYNADRVIATLQNCVSAKDLACFQLNVKFPFLISNHQADYDRWQQWFPEANAHIASHQVSSRARFLESCAAKHRYVMLKLHYLLIHRLIYGILYPTR